MVMKKIMIVLLFAVVILAGCGKEEKAAKEKKEQEKIVESGSWQMDSVGGDSAETETGAGIEKTGTETEGWEYRALTSQGENIYALSEKGEEAALSILDRKGTAVKTVSLEREKKTQAQNIFVSDGVLGVVSVLGDSVYYERYDMEGKQLSCSAAGESSVTAGNCCASGDGYFCYDSNEKKFTFYGADGKMGWERKLEAQLWYDCMACGPDGDFYILVFGDKIEGKRLLLLDPGTGETKKEMDLPKADISDIPQMFFGEQGEELYLYSAGTGIYRIDMKTEECVQLLDWAGSGIDGEKVTGVCPYEEGFLCISGGVGLSRLTLGEKEEKQVLVLGINDRNREILDAVREFNKGHQIQVKVKDYSCYPPNDPGTKLQLDIAKGECPDILDQSVMGMESLMDKGAFEDLYSYMEKDPQMQPELFLDNVLKLMERDGKLYFMPTGFSLEVLTCRKDLLGEENAAVKDQKEGISLETLRSLKKKNPDKSVFGGSVSNSREGVLAAILLSGAVEPYFASEEAEEKLKQLLEFSRTFPENDLGTNSFLYLEDELRSGSSLFHVFDISSLSYDGFFKVLDNGYGKGNYAIAGYPSIEGSGVYLKQMRSQPKLGISSSCKNKEAAWEFVRFLLMEKVQESNLLSGLPVRKKAFEKKLTKEYVDENGKKRSISKKEKKLAYRLVDSAGYCLVEGNSVEADLREIILEEAGSYFSGDKSVDEVMKVIKNRVSLFISEQE